MEAKPGHPGFAFGKPMNISTKLLVLTAAVTASYLFYQSFYSGGGLPAAHSAQISRPLLDSDFETQDELPVQFEEKIADGVAVAEPESTQVEVALGDYIDPEVLVSSASDQTDINIGDYVDPEDFPIQSESTEEINIGENLDPEDLPVVNSNSEEINIGPTLDAEEIQLDDTEQADEPNVNTQTQIIP